MRYLLLASLCVMLSYLVYWLLMRREKRHQMVRLFLLGTLLLSFLLPLAHLKISTPMEEAWQSPAVAEVSPLEPMAEAVEKTAAEGVSTLSPSMATAELQAPAVMTAAEPLWQRALLWIWMAGCACVLASLAVSALRLRHRLRKLSFEERGGVRLALVEEEMPAFSFGRHVVVGTRGFSEAEVRQLVDHERVHVRQWHTLDVLLCQAAKVVLWFNPFVYLYERELKRVHEYIVDEAMKGADYAELFYHQLSGKPYVTLGNAFDYGIVRQRIAMMSRRKSRGGWLKPMAFLPVVAMVLLTSSVKTTPVQGTYRVEEILLKSDNPAEVTLPCSEFLGLEQRTFRFDLKGNLFVTDRRTSKTQKLTYTLVDSTLTILDGDGKPWLGLMMHMRPMDKNRMMLRFTDPKPVDGLEKMLLGLSHPMGEIRKVTVMRRRAPEMDDRLPYEAMVEGVTTVVYPGDMEEVMDTAFARIVGPLDLQDSNWFRVNRLLICTAGSASTERHGPQKERKYNTVWEYEHNVIQPNARTMYDTINMNKPHLADDRFILEVMLRRQ